MELQAAAGADFAVPPPPLAEVISTETLRVHSPMSQNFPHAIPDLRRGAIDVHFHQDRRVGRVGHRHAAAAGGALPEPVQSRSLRTTRRERWTVLHC